MRILIADDDPVCRHELAVVLAEWGYEPTCCEDGLSAWELLQRSDAPRLAVLDWMMPGMEGPEVCKRLRDSEDNRHTQVLLLTVRGQKRDIVAGIEAGADDYVTKPFDHTELRARLTAAVRNLDVHEKLIRVQAQIRREARKDPLTGLPNRTAIIETLHQALLRHEREQVPVSAAVIDLDHFKSVNDSLGHLAGDEALREVVRRMQENIRPYDSLGRYGGDEFLLVAPGMDARDVATLAERFRLAVAHEPVIAAGQQLHQTITVGVADAGTGRTGVADLVDAADRALLEAKRIQRDSVRICSDCQSLQGARTGN